MMCCPDAPDNQANWRYDAEGSRCPETLFGFPQTVLVVSREVNADPVADSATPKCSVTYVSADLLPLCRAIHCTYPMTAPIVGDRYASPTLELEKL